MREILFRGKREDTGEWVYGYLVNATWYSDGSPMTMIVPTDTDVYPCSEIMYEEVLPETVGQWTGLVDKNGTKIFEGDVIREPGRPDYLLIIFDESSFQYRKPKWHDGYSVPIDDVESDCLAGICYIEGNIYDNPELLEVCE